MNSFPLIMRAIAQTRWREARQHLYALLILSPLVLGMTYFTALRLVSNAQADAWHPSFRLFIICGIVVEICLVGMSMSRAVVEIYHPRRAESYLDALPVSINTHLHIALVNRIARTAIAGIVALFARSFFDEGRTFDVSHVWSLLLFIGVTSLAEILAAINWVHWGHARDAGVALLSVVMLLFAIVLGGLLLTTIILDGLSDGSQLWLTLGGVICASVLYLYVRSLHRRWRIYDLEFAKRLQKMKPWLSVDLPAARKQLGRVVAAQLTRDLQLTFRTFSSAVYVVLGLGVLVTVTLFALLTTYPLQADASQLGWFDATWYWPIMATKVASIVITLSLAALLPVLVSYQRSHLWLERAVGTTGAEMWRAKMWYTKTISLPAPFVAWMTGLLTGQIPWFYTVPLLAECLWLWWMVSTLIGLLSFEIPERPALAMIIMGGFGGCLGFFVSLCWPLGLIPYTLGGVREFSKRGCARALYYLSTEGD